MTPPLATALPAPWATAATARIDLPTTPLIGSPQTVGIWLLAAAPLVTNLVVFVTTFVVVMLGNPAPLPILVALPVIALEWVAAGLDRSALRRRGYAAPSIAWMLLLPPLVYFIRRGRAVRAAGQKAWPPELVYFIQIALGFVVGIAASALGSRY